MTRSRPSLRAGVLAGLCAGMAGAFGWISLSAVTHRRLAFVSIGLGVVVAVAATKAARTRRAELGIVAALVTLVACGIGDVGASYAVAMHAAPAGPFGVLAHDLSHDKLALCCYAISALAASRLGSRAPAPVRPSLDADAALAYVPRQSASPDDDLIGSGAQASGYTAGGTTDPR